MELKNYFSKDSLHHAYLIEGEKSLVLPELLAILDDLKINTSLTSDMYATHVDTFKIEDARKLKSLAGEKGFGASDAKRVFIISAESFLPEAQNALLKVFEEPIPHTHFFVLAPSVHVFIPTLLSRLYVIKHTSHTINDKVAHTFMSQSLPERVDFLKGLLSDTDDEGGNEESPRSKALQFLDSLEVSLHAKFAESYAGDLASCFEQIFTARKYLRQPGSSAKMLMESLALVMPEK
jgi:hypothetical protein